MSFNLRPRPDFADPSTFETATPIWPVTEEAREGWLATLPEAQRAWLDQHNFEGYRREVLCVPGPDGRLAGVAFGLGKGGAEGRVFGELPFNIPEGVYRIDPLEGIPVDLTRASLGWILGAYTYRRYKLGKQRGPGELAPPTGVDTARVMRMARGMMFARDLINTPAQDMGPLMLETAARALVDDYPPATMTTIQGEALLEENYPMIHTVGRAAAQEPRLLDINWAGPNAKMTVTLVGKGVCFDTGGLDIKPSSSMMLMKKDMGGAASVMGLALMIMDAKLPITLRVLIPAVENSISASSFRPGDVLRARNDLTVENRNTDAEGRLVLGDALVEASESKPDLIFDMATLTGAARVALGPDLQPFFTDDDDLAAEIAAAGTEMDDPVWRLPLWDGYENEIGSNMADLNNAPGGGMAGSVTAALFLRRFLKNSYKWAHFDIYGWAPRTKPGRPEGGECQAALALFKLLEDRCA